jgi:EAL domain-containing protein (putative c-di-GMP-specific phosphodiesterase class I)
MLLPQTKEREYRFKLALRMGLPIFALIIAFISHTLISNYETLQPIFYVEASLVLLVSVYFLFYLIYNGFEVKITDGVSGTFAREYLMKYLKKELQTSKHYTFVLVSVENLHDINKEYGLKNGDKVLQEVVRFVVEYLQKEGIENFPFGHIKGGDLLFSLEGEKENYSTLVQMLLLKTNDFKVDDIEVKIAITISDTHYSRDLDYLIEHLFVLLEKEKLHKEIELECTPSEIESRVFEAIEKNALSMMFQEVFDAHNQLAFKEVFVKIQTTTGKLLYPKSYMKVIKKLGLGITFDLLVIENVVKFGDKSHRYAINISPSSLRNEKFLSRVKEIVKESGFSFIFILSEMEYYANTQRFNAILSSLQKMGVTFVIDRLGSFHTSFLYLRELNIDIVRFDTYYANYEKMVQNRAILEGFVTMAHKKNVKTWMKNLEDKQSLLEGHTLEIDYFQGKYLANLKEN